MTALHAQPQPGEPLTPMPALTPDALRAAVEELTPSRMPAFVRDLIGACARHVGGATLCSPHPRGWSLGGSASEDATVPDEPTGGDTLVIAPLDSAHRRRPHELSWRP